jgi:hypothetical protein
MRRELLLLEEMIDAAQQAHLLAADQTAESLASDVSGVRPCSGTSPSSARPVPADVPLSVQRDRGVLVEQVRVVDGRAR